MMGKRINLTLQYKLPFDSPRAFVISLLLKNPLLPLFWLLFCWKMCVFVDCDWIFTRCERNTPARRDAARCSEKMLKGYLMLMHRFLPTTTTSWISIYIYIRILPFLCSSCFDYIVNGYLKLSSISSMSFSIFQVAEKKLSGAHKGCMWKNNRKTFWSLRMKWNEYFQLSNFFSAASNWCRWILWWCFGMLFFAPFGDFSHSLARAITQQRAKS